MVSDNKTKDNSVLDVLIVGGGPAGLNAALILGRACRRVMVIDSGSPRNQDAQRMNGFIGRDGTDPRQLLADGRAELRRYGVDFVDDTVVEVTPVSDPGAYGVPSCFAVGTRRGGKYAARKILFATGVCDDIPAIPGAEACHGITVHHCPYCDGWEHREQHLLSYGTDAEAAIGQSLALRGWSSHVTVLTDGTRISAEDRQQLTANGISWREQRVAELVHREGTLFGVRFEEGEMVSADALFYNTSQRPHCDLPQKLGCTSDSSGRTETSPKQQAAQPGVFVAGDACGKVQMVIVAAAEGATAAVAINRELQEEDRVKASTAAAGGRN